MPNHENALNLIEIFASVQGETSLSGLPTTFIRLAACNLRCTWCDTTYSFGRGTPFLLTDIVKQVDTNGCPYICVTGGEPLLQQNVYQLMSELCDKNYTVSIETGGSLSTGNIDLRVITILDIKCPGSGMSQKNYWENLNHLRPHDEVKFVVKDLHDYQYAKDVAEKYHLYDREKPILLSPVFGILEAKELVQWMLKDQLKARLNLQMHKFIWDPATKGV